MFKGKNKKHFNPTLKISCTPTGKYDSGYIEYLERREEIADGIALVKEEGDTCKPYRLTRFLFESECCQETDNWVARINLSNRLYEISREKPYDSDFIMVFFFRTKNFNVLIAISRPILDVPISGVFLELGIRGINYYKVAEAASGYIQAIADENTRKALYKDLREITGIDKKADFTEQPSADNMIEEGNNDE